MFLVNPGARYDLYPPLLDRSNSILDAAALSTGRRVVRRSYAQIQQEWVKDRPGYLREMAVRTCGFGTGGD
jgi:hypothetical protein